MDWGIRGTRIDGTVDPQASALTQLTQEAKAKEIEAKEVLAAAKAKERELAKQERAQSEHFDALATVETAVPLPLPLPSEVVAAQPYVIPGHAKATTKGRAAGVMLVAGSSPEYIAEVLEFGSPAAAKQQAMRALSETLDFADREAIKDLLGARLEALFRQAYGRSQDPRYKNREAATGTALAIIDKQMRLFGLAAPTQVTVTTATDQQIRDFVGRVAEERMRQLPAEVDVIRGEVAG